MVLKLSSTPFKKDDLPSDKDEILKAGQYMARDVQKRWKKGKLYKFKNPDGMKYEVQTYYTNHGSEYWLSRVSKHKVDKKTYEKILYYLNGSERSADNTWFMKDRSKRSKLEVEYIEVLSKCEVLDRSDSGWILVNLEYDLGKPLTIREFNEWAYPIEPYMDENGKEASMVVSLNADQPMKPGSINNNHTPAYYVSVETLEYDYKTQELVWLMCTTSDAGGNVPKWLQNATIAKTVAKDVPYLFDFISKK